MAMIRCDATHIGGSGKRGKPSKPTTAPLALVTTGMSGSPAAPVPLFEDVEARKQSHAAELAQKVVLAGASNMTAACVTNVFDLVKVRQQLLIRTASTAAAPTSWPSILVSMVRQEGFLSIYKGLSGSLLREASYSGIRMGSFDAIKGLLAGTGVFTKDTLAIKLTAGMASGMLGASIANPADLLKVRLQAHGATGTLRSHASSIVQQSGIKGLYRAVWPTTIRAGVLTASQLGTYDHTKHTLLKDFPNTFQEGFKLHFISSGIAGFVCSAASNPIDVVKVRMMQDNGQYRSALHCVALILKNEGPLKFYSGFTMSFLRLWPHSVLSLLCFEALRKYTGLNPI